MPVITWRHIKSHLLNQERVDEGGEASEGAQGAGVGATRALWGPFLGQFGLFPTLAGPCLVVWEVGSEEQGGWCAHPCASAATTSGWGCWVPPSRAPPPSSAAMRSSGTPSTPLSSKNKVNPGQTMQYQTENTTTTSYKSHDSDPELIITLSFLNLHLSCWAGDYM